MKAVAICFKGTENICAKEISEILNVKSKINEGAVLFETNLENIAKFSYLSQSSNRILLVLDEFKISSIEELSRIKKLDLKEYSGKTFAARCHLINSDFDRREIEMAVGEYIDLKVNLKNPDITFFTYIYEDYCYFGIDFSGDISKRQHKLQTYRFDLKGTVAYSIMRLSGYTGKGIFLDPFCSTGTLAIEAALFASNVSPRFFLKENFPFHKLIKIDLAKFDFAAKENEIFAFDKESGHISIARKNAKAAGIAVNFSKLEPEWIDTKFEEKKVIAMASNAPRITSYNQQQVSKLFKDFFNQAKYALADKGKIALISNQKQIIEESAEREGFILEEEIDIEIGQEMLKAMVFTKSFKKP